MTTAPKSLLLAPRPAFLCYTGALLVYSASLYVGSRLNPRDMWHGSWTDPYLQSASGASFLCCLVAPWVVHGSLLHRFSFFCVGLIPVFAAFWLWYVTCA